MSLETVNENSTEAVPHSSSTTTTTTTTTTITKEDVWTKLWNFYEEYEILILFFIVIGLAKLYPPLGAQDVFPHVTATWIAVIFIFVVAGLDLKTEEFHSAFQELYFNAFCQLFNFGGVSLIVFGLTRILLMGHFPGLEPLIHGMIICSCLPMAINMVFILTKTAGGDEAAAILNATFANLVGVFLSPLLILAYMGVSSGDKVNLLEVFGKLAVRIVLPLFVGQVIQKQSPGVVQFMKTYKRQVKKSQIYALVFIVYTVFCTTFASGTEMPIRYVFIVLGLQLVLLCTLMIVAWLALTTLFPKQPQLCVMGLFGCTFKTVSVGVPMINAMYEGSSNVGLYTLPLLMWHPTQLLVGSILTPHLKAYIDRQPRLNEEGDDTALDSLETAPKTERSPLIALGSPPN